MKVYGETMRNRVTEDGKRGASRIEDWEREERKRK